MPKIPGGGYVDDASWPLTQALVPYMRSASLLGVADTYAVLQSLQLEHRLDRSLNEFFNGRITPSGGSLQRIDIDAYWTSSGIRCPAGYTDLEIYSRRAFMYPQVNFHCKLPTLDAFADTDIGLAAGERSLGVTEIREEALIAKFSAETPSGQGREVVITNLLPPDYDTVQHNWSIKVNKCSVELFIDDEVKAIHLLGLPVNIPKWEDNPPYALWGQKGLFAMCMSTMVEVERRDASEALLELDPTDEYNCLTATDGDPLPPRQFALYNENTSIKWNGQVIAAGSITSHPVPVWGYPKKSLYFQANGVGSLEVQLYLGGGWRTLATVPIAAGVLDPEPIDVEVPIIRCVFTPTAYPTTVNVAEVYIS